MHPITTLLTIDIRRSGFFRDLHGQIIEFGALAPETINRITFAKDTGLALWKRDGDGLEPPPYWADEKGQIHTT